MRALRRPRLHDEGHRSPGHRRRSPNGRIAHATSGTAGVHVSFDLDVCDPAIAPGVGTPVKGGLDYREAHMLMEMVADSGRLHRARPGRGQPGPRRPERHRRPGRRARRVGVRDGDSLDRGWSVTTQGGHGHVRSIAENLAGCRRARWPPPRVAAQKVVTTKVGGGGSPHETVEWTVEGAKITIIYGRPFLKGALARHAGAGRQGLAHRRRRGDDAHHRQAADVRQPDGAGRDLHALHACRAPATWKLVVSKQTGQWGTGTARRPSQDLGRTDLKDREAAEAGRAVHHRLDDTPRRRRSTSTGAPRAQTVAVMVR